MSHQELLKRDLQAAIEGLFYPSESDAPFAYICFPAEAHGDLDRERLLDLLDVPTNTPVNVQSPDAFFGELIKPQEWWGETEKLDAEKYRVLRRLMEQRLASLTVFRVGEVEVDVYVLGAYEDDLVGLHTRSVET